MEISHEEINNLDDPLLIDVRSPAEFREDHIPGAVNLPVLTDEQRDEVGTLYHQQSTFLARKRGAREICENLPSILESIDRRADQDRPLVVYCWRGGLRSESLALILERIGYPTYRIRGGYKSYRRTVDQFFKNSEWPQPVITIYGFTGSGKTKLIHEINRKNSHAIDLEGAANHRGSAFGAVGKESQPSQKKFERNIYQQFQTVNAPVFLEGESRHIGSVRIPDPLFEDLVASPRVWIETDLDQRVEIIYNEYQWPDTRPELIEKLDKLRERLGNNRVEQLQKALSEDRVRHVIRVLLDDYYDPAYERSCPPRKEFNRVIHTSDLDQVAQDLTQWGRELIR